MRRGRKWAFWKSSEKFSPRNSRTLLGQASSGTRRRSGSGG
jgi:hypothetical protein